MENTTEKNNLNNQLPDIPINLIKKLDNSRLRINETDLIPLMEDIKHRGLLQPIGVIKEGDNYIIRFGNRRLEACKKLGWKTIPAIICDREIDEDSFMADNIAENFHRVDLNPIEIAHQCNRFLSRGYSISEISVILSIPKQRIISCLNIEKSAPQAFKSAIANIKQDDRRNKKGKISASVANEILTYSNYLSKEQKERLFEEAKSKEISAGQVRLIKNMVRNGMDLEQALNNYKEYKLCAVEIPFKLSELKKYNKTNIDLIKSFIIGDIKPNKYLIYTPTV